jgi:hypothetical protein
MHWDETSLFIYLKLAGTSTQSRLAPTLDMCLREKQACNKMNKHKRYKDLLPEFNLTS